MTNYQLGDQYIYAGTLNDAEPFSSINLTASELVNANSAVKQQVIREALGLGPLASAW